MMQPALTGVEGRRRPRDVRYPAAFSGGRHGQQGATPCRVLGGPDSFRVHWGWLIQHHATLLGLFWGREARERDGFFF